MGVSSWDHSLKSPQRQTCWPARSGGSSKVTLVVAPRLAGVLVIMPCLQCREPPAAHGRLVGEDSIAGRPADQVPFPLERHRSHSRNGVKDPPAPFAGIV